MQRVHGKFKSFIKLHAGVQVFRKILVEAVIPGRIKGRVKVEREKYSDMVFYTVVGLRESARRYGKQ
jgi:hypothetical protein